MTGHFHSDILARLAYGVPPSVHYVDDKNMPSAAQQAATVADWAWIILNSEFQKNLDRVRAMVFVPSLEEAQTLQAKIEAEKPDWVAYQLPVDAQDGLINTINTDFRNVVIIMLPYFGSRLPIRRVNQVLCPDTVQITLYEPTGEQKEIRQLPLEWIDFLSEYACPRELPCRIFYNFERAPHELERRQLELERSTQGSRLRCRFS